MWRWYVLELKGGGLFALCHYLDLRDVSEIVFPPTNPHFKCLKKDDFTVLADYETDAEAIAFIAGLELGHERREAVRDAMNKRLNQVLDKYQGAE